MTLKSQDGFKWMRCHTSLLMINQAERVPCPQIRKKMNAQQTNWTLKENAYMTKGPRVNDCRVNMTFSREEIEWMLRLIDW